MDLNDKAATGALSDHGSRQQTADLQGRTAPRWGRDLGCTAVSCMDLPTHPQLICTSTKWHSIMPRPCTGGLVQETSWSFFSYTQLQVQGNLREARILIWIKRQVRNREQDLWVIGTASSWTLGEVTQRKEGKGGDQEQGVHGPEDTEEDHLKGKLQEGAWERNETSRRKYTSSLLLLFSSSICGLMQTREAHSRTSCIRHPT